MAYLWYEEKGNHFFWKENHHNFEKWEILFLEGQHIYFFHVEIDYKKERKERKRRKGEGEDSFDCDGWKGVEEQEKGDCS